MYVSGMSFPVRSCGTLRIVCAFDLFLLELMEMVLYVQLATVENASMENRTINLGTGASGMSGGLIPRRARLICSPSAPKNQ